MNQEQNQNERVTSDGLCADDRSNLNLSLQYWWDGKPEEGREFFRQMREKYQDNLVALKNIDMFDPESEYTQKFNQMSQARYSEPPDLEKVAELESWFREHYSIDQLRITGKSTPGV